MPLFLLQHDFIALNTRFKACFVKWTWRLCSQTAPICQVKTIECTAPMSTKCVHIIMRGQINIKVLTLLCELNQHLTCEVPLGLSIQPTLAYFRVMCYSSYSSRTNFDIISMKNSCSPKKDGYELDEGICC